MTTALWTAAEAAMATGGRSSEDWSASGVSIDSRTVAPGDLFVALQGPAFDGHDFVAKAFAAGRSRSEVEDAWETATKTVRRLALALSGSADDDATVNKWKDGGAARRETLRVVNKGIHHGVEDFVTAVNKARLAVGDLAGTQK